MNNSPIYVCGPNRSGTSLLYALLASHPNLSMVQRTDMWRFFYGRYGDMRQEANFTRCLTDMLQYRRITRLNPDPVRIQQEYWQGEPGYGRLFSLIHQHFAEQRGKPRWGDKSLHTEHHAQDLFEALPNALMIQVLRDPRDRYASEHKKYNASVASATAKWLTSTQAAERNLRDFPDQYMVVRYEDLASQPTAVLQQVCTFIGESFTPAMLTMRGAPEHLEQGGDSSFEQFEPGEISTRSIGRFRKTISQQDIAFIQACGRHEMTFFDYALDPIEMSQTDRLSFSLVNLPANWSRMTYKRTRQKLNHRRGRTIPERRVLNESSASMLEEA